MRIVWSEKARDALRSTALYIRDTFGERSKESFLREIRQTCILLEKTPDMGQREILLMECPEQYRSLVVGRLNKIVYYINGEQIEIVALWDTRREPKSQAEETKE